MRPCSAGIRTSIRPLLGLMLVPQAASFLLAPPGSPPAAVRAGARGLGLPRRSFDARRPSASAGPTCMQKDGKAPTEELPTLFGLPRENVAQPLGLLLAAQFVLFVGVGAVIPTLPLYGKSIGLSSAVNGIVISAPAVALLLGARPAGAFADCARKPAMIGGMALIAISDVGTAFATSLAPLVVARLGLGAGRCISESGERGMLADLAARVPSLRGRAVGLQQAVSALGIAIGAPLGGLVVESYGPRAAFLCVSAAAAVSMLAYLFLPETVPEAPGDQADETNGTRWSELLQDNRWKALVIGQSGAGFGFACKIACIPVIAAAVLPGGAAGAGILLSAAGLSGLVGAPLGGWITDKAGARFTVLVSGLVSAVGLLLVPLALATPSFLGFGGDGVLFAAVVILWSVGAAAQGPALTALAQELAPVGAEATCLALPRAAGDGVYIIAPFLLGLVADSTPPGVECAVAGAAGLLGLFALAVLSHKES
jgi:predicted MFS family arabinose efflux permease